MIKMTKTDTKGNSDIIEVTKKLILFRTTSSNREELFRCSEFIGSYFKNSKIIVDRPTKTPSLVILKKNKNPKVFFVAHFDVVPAEEYKPRIEKNRLYGRGAIDCKVNVAILMKLIKESDGDFGLIITADEEVGGESLTQILEKYSCEFALVLDGGDDLDIVIKEKGALHVKISAQGKTAHGSAPWEGENAIDKLFEIYTNLKKEFPENEKKWRNTINIGKIQGGMAANQVPADASMWLDMRFTNNLEKDRIKSLLPKHDVLTDAAVLEVDTENKYIKQLQKSVKKFTGKHKLTREHGASDARHFAEKGISSALIWPIGGNVHAKDEYVELDSVNTLYSILKDFTQNLV